MLTGHRARAIALFVVAIAAVTLVVGRTRQRQVLLNHDLLSAVRRLNSIEVANLLRRGADANATEPTGLRGGIGQRLLPWLFLHRGEPAIILAFARCQKAQANNDPYASIIKSLLDYGADPRARSRESRTPVLIYACIYGSPDTVRLLLNRGALIALPEEDVAACLTISDLPVCVELLEFGANPNSRGYRGLTPLMAAQTAERVVLLLKYRADPYLVNDAGRDTMAEVVAGKQLLGAEESTEIIRELRRHGIDH